MFGQKTLFPLVNANAGGHREHAGVIGLGAFGSHKVRQAAAGAHGAVNLLLLGLLPQAVPGHGDLASGLVGVELNVVVVHGVCRVERDHRVGGEPAAFNGTLEQGHPVGVYPPGLIAHHLVLQDGRVRACQIPGLEERGPVDVLGQFGKVEVLEDAPADELGYGGLVSRPIDVRFVGAGPGQRPHRRLLFVGVLLADFVVVGIQFGNVGRSLLAQ